MQPTPMTPEDQLTAEIVDLETKLLEAHPQMPQLLAKIHHNLAQQPQLIQSLTDEQISVITKGLASYTKAAIITSKAKKPSGKSLKNTNVLDLL